MADEPEQKVAPWKWNKERSEAVQLLAADELTDQEIANKIGVQRKTLWGWKKIPAFAAKLEQARARLGALAERYAVTRKARRLEALTDRWERMRRVIEERAAAEEMRQAPGGQTGLLCRTMKSIGSGPSAEKVEEFEFDAALVKELREHEKQAAQEVGQWIDKSEVGGLEGQPILFMMIGKPPVESNGDGNGEQPRITGDQG